MSDPNTNTDAPKGPDHCMFLEIAPELRNRIYQELFDPDPDDKPVVSINRKYHLPPILKGNKQIHHEAIQIYYSSTVFEALDDTDRWALAPEERDYIDGCVDRWLKKLPSKYRALIPIIRFLELDYQECLEEQIAKLRGLPATETYLDHYRITYVLGVFANWAREKFAGRLEWKQIELPWIGVGQVTWEWKVLSEKGEV